jgi:hypothetical protein
MGDGITRKIGDAIRGALGESPEKREERHDRDDKKEAERENSETTYERVHWPREGYGSTYNGGGSSDGE